MADTTKPTTKPTDKVANVVRNTAPSQGYGPGETAPADLYLVDGKVTKTLKADTRGTVLAAKGQRVAPHIAAIIARLS